eukprot:jgi/Botrbrau1/21872/Bobra.0249s0003.1
MEASEVADEECSFSQVLEHFLDKARPRRDALLRRSEAVQKEVRQLAEFLGEPAESDPAAIFGLVWAFAQAFDAAYLTIAKRQQAEAAEANRKSPGKGKDKAAVPQPGPKKPQNANGSLSPLQELSQAVKKLPGGPDAEAAPAKGADPEKGPLSGTEAAAPAGDSGPSLGSAETAKKGSSEEGVALTAVPNRLAEGKSSTPGSREDGPPSSVSAKVSSPPVADVAQGGAHGHNAENGRRIAGIPAQG